MNRYDDDRVIALLRETVPTAPDVPDRIAAIRSRAGRQRAALWTQTIGVAASVLVLVGVVAAVASPRGGDVEPTGRPVEAMAEALLRQRSVRFEAWTEPLDAAPKDVHGLTGHATGAATAEGDLRLDGDVPFLMPAFLGANGDGELRVVDDVLYTKAPEGLPLPAGKRWVRWETDESLGGVEELVRLVRMVEAVAEDVAYTGQGTVRGTPVAEYRMRVDSRWSGGRDVDITLALDARSLPRRVTVALGPLATAQAGDELSLPLRVEVELFGYGDRVDIEAPPAHEVATEAELGETVMDGTEYGTATIRPVPATAVPVPVSPEPFTLEPSSPAP